MPIIKMKDPTAEEELHAHLEVSEIAPRRIGIPVMVGKLKIGGGAPVRVQSMTNTDTGNVEKTVDQVVELIEAGSELVRMTVKDDENAKAVPLIKKKLIDLGYGDTPLVGDFHYNGHILLTKYPQTAQALDKYRINPGNVGFGDAHDDNFEAMLKVAIDNDKPCRIGVNWGSLDQRVLARLMDQNAKLAQPKPSQGVVVDAVVTSALESAKFAVNYGLEPNKIVLSCKCSHTQELVRAYTMLASGCEHSLHLGITEGGYGVEGIIKNSVAQAILLQKGIGDTVRVSMTHDPTHPRRMEVLYAQQILQGVGVRQFFPSVTSCPGCGRTTSTLFQSLAGEVSDYLKNKMPEWKKEGRKGVQNFSVAVMGCIVNGPGESKSANMGISLPGTGEDPVAAVFIDGKHAASLQGGDRSKKFMSMIDEYVHTHYPTQKA